MRPFAQLLSLRKVPGCVIVSNGGRGLMPRLFTVAAANRMQVRDDLFLEVIAITKSPSDGLQFDLHLITLRCGKVRVTEGV